MADDNEIFRVSDASIISTDNEDKDGNFSDDSQTESSTFEPIPYTFTLNDVYGTEISLPPGLATNSKISCPPFDILLDHVIAVLWIVYSNTNTEVLQSTHVHWALKFLEGLRDKNNRHTSDVGMAITQLQDILMDMCANVDVDELDKRNISNSNVSRYRRFLLAQKCGECYENFEGFLKKNETTNDEGITETEIVESELLDEVKERDKNTYKPSPSVILEDMLLTVNPLLLKDIVLSSTKSDCPCVNPSEECTPGLANANKENEKSKITEDIVSWRENQYAKIIKQLQQMSTLDEAFKNLKCTGSTDIISKLENFVNQ